MLVVIKLLNVIKLMQNYKYKPKSVVRDKKLPNGKLWKFAAATF